MKIATPLIALIVIAGFTSVQAFLLAYYDQEPSRANELFWSFGFPLFLAWWVQKDRFYKAKDAPYEYLAFIYIFWIIALPWYLIQTRGWKGILIFSGFLFLYWADYFSAWLAIYFWEFMNL
jgi:hypothetical protein